MHRDCLGQDVLEANDETSCVIFLNLGTTALPCPERSVDTI